MKRISISHVKPEIAKSLVKRLKLPQMTKEKLEAKINKWPHHRKWTVMFGSHLEVVDAPHTIYDAEGAATRKVLVRKLSHDPGTIIDSRAGVDHKGRYPNRYMVQPNGSLHVCV